MSIAIIGSRTFDDYQTLESVVLNTLKEKDVKLSDITIVSGGAKGADSLGRDFAQKYGTQYKEFLPDWEKFGKSAGFIRNNDIVEHSDFVIAFWDGQSKGTRHSLELARKAGKPYYAYNFMTKMEERLAEQEKSTRETLLTVGDSGQDAAQTVALVHKDGADKFAEAGFSAHYAPDGSPRSYQKSPHKTEDGGAVTIRIEPRANGAFAVLSEYEKDRILDGRRKYAVTASSVDEALETVASFEKYLLPEAARPAEQTTFTSGLRLR
ncbi:MAG: DUF2493 domain-containing protein [Desulfovibrio sp.]|jgi:hypothetical protein|nr:DUF2493 domain-containing protein [Desulfovibrio sp.]